MGALSPTRASDRPTHRFTARSFHDGAYWGSEVHAHDLADAEAGCKVLNKKLDGQHMATPSCIPAAMPVARPLVRLASWFRNTISRTAMQG